jgi:hypothetical protein
MSQSEAKFRINRQKVGLTYSCPVDKEHPIASKEVLLEWLEGKFGALEKYTICQEPHKNGKKHYHADLKFAEKLDIKDALAFDFEGCHPNIIKPGSGWLKYCVKGDNFISNCHEESVFKRARDADTWDQAADLLWQDPKFMLQHGDRAERNWKRRKCHTSRDVVYYGPTRSAPEEWNPHKQALVISGPSGCGKTQWALDWARQRGFQYLKCSDYQGLKRICPDHQCVIFDDADESLNKQDYSTWISLSDVEQERDFRVLHGCVSVKAMPKIFTTNSGLTPSDNAAGAVQRRIFYWDWTEMKDTWHAPLVTCHDIMQQ